MTVVVAEKLSPDLGLTQTESRDISVAYRPRGLEIICVKDWRLLPIRAWRLFVKG